MRTIMLSSLALILSGTALAERSIQSVLSSEELQKELFGVHLQGVAALDETSWSECVEPGGKTIFSHQGVERTGHMTIRENGLACFTYEEEGIASSNCFSVARDGVGGYVFSSVTVQSAQFRATSVTRNIKSCPVGPGKTS